ncbi:MAG: hypothetical protein MUF64_14970 [Polyangiaceae bacterium]|nr:hypothetical protein [Polyangiaceae bacterium]
MTSPLLRRRLIALVGLLAVLCAVLLRGQPYARCAVDGVLHFSACCQLTRWEDGQAFDDASCCTYQERPDLAPAFPGGPSLDLTAALPPPGGPALRALSPPLARAAPPPTPAPGRPPARAPPPPPLARRLALLARLLS